MQVNLVCVDEAHVFKHAEDTLQTHTSGGDFITFSVRLCILIFIPRPSVSFPHQGCRVIRKGAGRVRELSVAWVNLLHWFNAGHQQLRHLFLWNLQRMCTQLEYKYPQQQQVLCNSKRCVPSCGISSFHWPGGTWTEPHEPSCKAETRRGE